MTVPERYAEPRIIIMRRELERLRAIEKAATAYVEQLYPLGGNRETELFAELRRVARR